MRLVSDGDEKFENIVTEDILKVVITRVDACERKVVISLIYHHSHDVDINHIAESRIPPWNFRVASALANIGKCKTIAIRPTNLGKFLVKTIQNMVLISIPHKIQNLGMLDKIINKLKVLSL